MKALKKAYSALSELVEIIASIPFAGIIRSVFNGTFGWQMPIAFVSQVAVQAVSAHVLGLPLFATVTVGTLLFGLHLFMGINIGMLPLAGMSPGGGFRSLAQLATSAFLYSLIVTGVLGGVILGLAALIGHVPWAVFCSSLALSTIGGTAIHMLGVVVGFIARVLKQK